MKVVFLDFDGVLIHLDCYFNPRLKLPNEGARADPACMMWLALLVRETDARIVVSSAWRGRRQLTWLRRKLQQWGLPNARRRVIGMTGRKLSREDGGRGAEIRAWLESHPEVIEYVIIDDDPIELTEGIERRRVVHVKYGHYTGGFRSYHADLAARVLGVEKFSYRAKWNAAAEAFR